MFVFFRVLVSWQRWGGRIVERVGSADGVACRMAGRGAGRDDRLMAKWVLCVARSLFSYRLFGYGGEAIDAPFLSARLGGLSGGGGGGGGGGIMDGCAGGWR